MTRAEFIQQAVLKFIDPKRATHSEVIFAAVSLADELEARGAAPWTRPENGLEGIKEAIHELGSPVAPIFVVTDDAIDLDHVGMRTTDDSKQAAARVVARLTRKRS